MEITINPPINPPTIFHVELPEHLNPELDGCIVKTARIFWDVLSYVIFPIILLRCLANCLRKLLFFIIVPGDYRISGQELQKKRTELLKFHNGEQITLNLSDGTSLSGVFVEGLRHPEKVIIYAFGNGGQWETSEEYITTLQLLFGTSILMINPRGVGESRGVRSSAGYGIDTYAGYEFLQKKKGIDLDHILLIGHSMGAAYGSCGAAITQEKYPDKKISMIHDRSFHHLTTETDAVISNQSCCCLGAFASCFFSMLGMEIDSEEAFEKLKGKKCVIYSTSDPIIPYERASLHKSLMNADCRHFDEIPLLSEPEEDVHNSVRFGHGKFIEFVESCLKLEKRQQNLQSLIDQFEQCREAMKESINHLKDNHRQLFVSLASGETLEASNL